MTSFESLPDVILLELFEFFDAIHLLYMFHDLNSRFNWLLFTCFQAYHVDFRFASRQDFNHLCDEYLPQIGNKIRTLRLSNADDTPLQVDSFLLKDNLFQQFTRLQVLSLYHILSEDNMKTISYELEHLSVLTHLKIIQCCVPSDQIDFMCFINNIWNSSKLKYLYLDVSCRDEQLFFAPTMTSSSILHISIKNIPCDYSEIITLMRCTPCLQYLKADINQINDDIVIKSDFSSLKSLTLSFTIENDSRMMSFWRNMVSLQRLTIDIYGSSIDGYQWEKIIRDYLPNLKLFQLKEQIPMVDQNQGNQQVDTLVESFKNQFWLEERKWFIRCDWILADTYSTISLYTLPYSFRDFKIECVLASKSTCPKNCNDESYDQVRNLYNNNFLDNTVLPHYHFRNVRHLNVEAPVNSDFLVILPMLNQLTALTITLFDNDDSNSQLQILLNRGTNLRSLTINSSSAILTMSFIQNINTPVFRCDLQGTIESFNQEQYITLINSPLCVRCEMLAINVKHCDDILNLINNMIYLRALCIVCEEDEWNYDSSSDNDDLINWLRQCLPPSCIVIRDMFSHDRIHLWIR